MFWTNNKILSYNKPFNFVIGERTGGKTFDSKNLAIRTFKNDGKLTVWIRREKTELSKQFRMQFFTEFIIYGKTVNLKSSQMILGQLVILTVNLSFSLLLCLFGISTNQYHSTMSNG